MAWSGNEGQVCRREQGQVTGRGGKLKRDDWWTDEEQRCQSSITFNPAWSEGVGSFHDSFTWKLKGLWLRFKAVGWRCTIGEGESNGGVRLGFSSPFIFMKNRLGEGPTSHSENIILYLHAKSDASRCLAVVSVRTVTEINDCEIFNETSYNLHASFCSVFTIPHHLPFPVPPAFSHITWVHFTWWDPVWLHTEAAATFTNDIVPLEMKARKNHVCSYWMQNNRLWSLCAFLKSVLYKEMTFSPVQRLHIYIYYT